MLSILSILAGLAGKGGCEHVPEPPEKAAGPQVAIINSRGEEWRVSVELARTPRERARGLMWRWSLPEDGGMLFIFNDVRQRSFYMKNTRIPLDMIFIGPGGRIAGIVENAEPMTTSSRKVEAPSKWVLEVNGGLSSKHGLAPGDRVYFFNIDGIGGGE